MNVNRHTYIDHYLELVNCIYYYRGKKNQILADNIVLVLTQKDQCNYIILEDLECAVLILHMKEKDIKPTVIPLCNSGLSELQRGQ
jgi:hypothetical protein